MKPSIIAALLITITLGSITSTGLNLRKLKEEVNNICIGIDKDKNISDKTWVSKKIECMNEKDQLVRKEWVQNEDNALISYRQKLDEAHTNDLKEILKVHGWLVIS